MAFSTFKFYRLNIRQFDALVTFAVTFALFPRFLVFLDNFSASSLVLISLCGTAIKSVISFLKLAYSFCFFMDI